MALRFPDPAESSRQYRRGAVMGLTVAEAFMLLAFVLLMLMLLWRAEDARKLERVEDFAALPPADQQVVIEVSRLMREAGLRPEDPAARRTLEALVALDQLPATQTILAELVGASDAERRKLDALIRTSAWREGEEATIAERVTERLVRAAENRSAVTEALRAELGDVVAAAGGVIETDGALVFPDTVLFEAGRSDITPELRAFLETICLPWFRTLEGSGAAISDLRIEGHASSEWIGMSPETAYLANLALSQERAHAVLSTCLQLVPGPEGAWARERATAVGYSSSHPVLIDGQEDRGRSRRVVFRVDFSLDEVIQGIEDDVQATRTPPIDSDKIQLFGGTSDAPPSVQSESAVLAPPDTVLSGKESGTDLAGVVGATVATEPVVASGGDVGAAPIARKRMVVGVASVIDADTIEVHGERIRLHGIDAPESSQVCLDSAGVGFRCGQRAAMGLSDRIGRQTVSCDPRDIDRYGRTVAVCHVGEEDLGAWLVRAGLAFAYRQYSTDYVALEEEARLSRSGLWSGSFEFPWDVR